MNGWNNEPAIKKNVACLLNSVNSKALFLESFDLTVVKETAIELSNNTVDKYICLALEYDLL